MIYVLGLGKSGLSVIRYLTAQKQTLMAFDTRLDPPELALLQTHYPQVPLHLGPLSAEILAQAEKIIISPGLSLQEPALRLAQAKGIPIIGDIEYFVQKAQAPIIAITGTNAKGTVTTLVAAMLKAAGLKIALGGNIGIPVLDLLTQSVPDYYVLELSSFQLESTYTLKTKAAVILNLSEDHLDRHGSMENYLSAKKRIYQGAEQIIVNRDMPSLWPDTPVKWSFGSDEPKSDQALGLRNTAGIWYLAQGQHNLLPCECLKIQGQHNALNVLAALAIGLSLSLPIDQLLKAACQFTGLAHRCQYIRTLADVTWYNDSKATNVGATLAALNGLGPSGKIVLIAGGQAKGQDFKALIPAMQQYCRAVVLLGQDQALLADTFNAYIPLYCVQDLSQAVAIAQNLAESGDCVLLSPACASLDMFKNYEDRGEQFTVLVQNLKRIDTAIK